MLEGVGFVSEGTKTSLLPSHGRVTKANNFMLVVMDSTRLAPLPATLTLSGR